MIFRLLISDLFLYSILTRLNSMTQLKFPQTLSLYKALGDETRLRIVRILEYGYFHVNELLEILGMGQSRVSRHLKILYQAGVLTTRREGTHVFYSLKPNPEPLVKETLQSFLQHSERLIPDHFAVTQYLEERKKNRASFFNQLAPSWDQVRDQYLGSDSYLSQIKKLVDHSGLVVELGAGTGSLLLSLAKKSGEYLGLDMSVEMVRIASEKAAQLSGSRGKISFRIGDIEEIPLGDNTTETVMISLVLHHLVHPERAFEEAYRILKRGGLFIVHDFYKHTNYSYQDIYNHRWLGFEKDEIKDWFLRNHFKEPKFLSVVSPCAEKMFIGYAKK